LEEKMNEKTLEIACEKAKEKGEDPETYDISIVEEPEIWRVEFLPKEKGKLGGGFRVEIGKDDLEVKRFVYYQ